MTTLVLFICFTLTSLTSTAVINGITTHIRPESCRGVVSAESRVVVILSSGLEVMCDTQTEGGGWTVFQRRTTGQLEFYRGWQEYKYGFGDVDIGEFYLGNEHIHQMTVKKRYELRIDFDLERSSYYANYARFRLFGEAEGYRLYVSDYTGNAGESLNMSNGMKFSTFDKDQDSSSENCAVLFQGAWWYNRCHHSNFNGLWGSVKYGKGLNWYTTTTLYKSATKTEMKMRELTNY